MKISSINQPPDLFLNYDESHPIRNTLTSAKSLDHRLYRRSSAKTALRQMATYRDQILNPVKIKREYSIIKS